MRGEEGEREKKNRMGGEGEGKRKGVREERVWEGGGKREGERDQRMG